MVGDIIRRTTQNTNPRGNEVGADGAEQFVTSKRALEVDSEHDVDEKPQRKRGKTSTSKKQQLRTVDLAKPRRGRGASLSILVDQPLDIILIKICRSTTPRDLVSLMQVNRAFYNLLSSQAVTIWKAMRAEYKIPDPLPGMSEGEWAILLLGETKCEDCGMRHKKQVLPIFMFKKRLCEKCLKNRTLKANDIRHLYWKNAREIMFVIPSMSFEERSPSHFSRNEAKWVSEDLIKLQDPTEREAYITSGASSRHDYNTLYRLALDWLYWYRRREANDISVTRAKTIQRRLIDLGYSEEDARAVSRLDNLRKPKHLNRRGWKRIKGTVLELMDEHRAQSVSKHPNSGIFAQRRELVQEVYSKFKKSLVPGKWVGAPSIETICLFPQVLKILILPDTVGCTSKDFATALESYRSVVEGWSDLIRVEGLCDTSINHIAPNSFGPSFASSLPEVPDPHYFYIRFAKDLGNLAIHEFQCSRCPETFTSLYAAVRHNERTADSRHDRRGSLKAIPERPLVMLRDPHYVQIQLVYFSGMEIGTATVHDMDNKGDFFKCLECAASPERRALSIATWRECVNQHRHTQDHPDGIKFELVHQKIEDVRKCWTCAHCNIHIDALVTRREVHEHLLAVHSISNASVPGDFLYAGQY